MLKTFQHLTYREIQTFAKYLGLTAGGTRKQIIGRIRMYQYWQNKKQEFSLEIVHNKSYFKYFQTMFIHSIWMIWIYLILKPSKIHYIQPKLRLTN